MSSTTMPSSAMVVQDPIDTISLWQRLASMVLFAPLNPFPLYNAIAMVRSTIPATFIDAKKLANNEPVYRLNIGLPMIALTDHTSAKFFLSSTSDVFDRETGPRRFGPLGVPDRIIGRTMPVLASSDATGHEINRAFTVGLMHKRLPMMQKALDASQARAYTELFAYLNDNPAKYNIEDVALKIAGQFLYEWLLETGTCSVKGVAHFPRVSINKLQTDNWIGDLVGRLLSNAVNNEYEEDMKKALENINASPLFAEHVKMAEDLGMSTDDLDRWMMFFIQLNGVAGLGLPLQMSIAMLGTQHTTLANLRAELDGHELLVDTIESQFPLLDSFIWEVQRFFMRPLAIWREAMKDVVVPASNGKSYRIKKGELVSPFLPLCNRDPTVYPQANQFNARRFLNRPDLKKDVFAFGMVHGSGIDVPTSRFGCAARSAGVTFNLLKVVLGTWIQRVDWTFPVEPDFTDRFTGLYGPTTLGFATIKLRDPIVPAA